MRRGRPISVTDETIFDATRAVYTEVGVTASAVEIAKRAGVSEATIFKRFASKAGLFRAALGLDDRELERPFEDLVQRVGRGAVLSNLGRAASESIDVRRRLDPLARSEPDWRGIVKRRKDTSARLVEAYLREEHDASRLPHRALADLRAWSAAYVSALHGLDVDEAGSTEIADVVRALAVGLVGPEVHIVFGARTDDESNGACPGVC
jgi:AcrR family transcriptional regulator